MISAVKLPQPLDSRDAAWLIIIVAASSIIRFYHLGHSSLWLDEAFTIKLANLPLSTLWISAYDPTPPLYYTVIRVVMLVLGDSEFWLRFPSALCGILTIPVIYLAARRLADTRAAVVAALVLTLSFYNIGYSQEARAYALVSFSIAISFLGLITLWQNWSKQSSGIWTFLRLGGGWFSLPLLVALYSHNTSVFYWSATQLFFLHWWVTLDRSRPLLLYWTGLHTLILVLWLPWAVSSFSFLDTGIFRAMHYSGDMALGAFRWVHGFSIASNDSLATDLSPAILALAGLFSLRSRPSLLILLVALILCSSLLIWLVGFLLTPIYLLRTILWGSLFSAVLIGLGVSALPGKVGYGLAAATLLAALLNTAHYFRDDPVRREDWRAAARTFEEGQQAGDILFFRSDYVSIPFMYYLNRTSPDWEYIGWNCRTGTVSSGTLLGKGRQRTLLWNRYVHDPEAAVPGGPSTQLWVVEAQCFSDDASVGRQLIYPGWTLDQAYQFEGVKMFRLRPDISVSVR